MDSGKIRQAFFEDPEVMAMLDVKDRKELVDKVNKISTPDLAIILKGDKGEIGPPGIDGKDGESIEGPMGPRGFSGKDGESIIGPQGPAGKDSISSHTVETITEEVTIDDKFVKKVIAVMSKLPEKYKLDISSLRNAGSFLFNGKRYKTEELMHGSGTSSTGSFTIIPVTGTIDDSNVTFTSATLPTLLNINGSFYQQTGGAITWSRAGTTITLSGPVGLGGSIFGI